MAASTRDSYDEHMSARNLSSSSRPDCTIYLLSDISNARPGMRSCKPQLLAFISKLQLHLYVHGPGVENVLVV
jgi:hypothetical protein